MVSEEERKKLLAELAELEKENRELIAVRDAKIGLIKAKLKNIPASFGAKHPVLYTLLPRGWRSAKKLAKEGKKHANEVADYVEYANTHPGKGWASYKKRRKKLVKV